MLLHLFYWVSITLMPNRRNDNKPTLLTNTEANFWNHALANRIQRMRNRRCIMTEWGLLQECNVGLTFKNQCAIHHIHKTKEKNHMIISTDVKKKSEKVKNIFMIKKSKQARKEANSSI